MAVKSALLILDMLNTLDFPEGKTLAKRALPVAQNILRLKHRCLKKNIPVIYVNDNFGDWKSDQIGRRFIKSARTKTASVVRLLKF